MPKKPPRPSPGYCIVVCSSGLMGSGKSTALQMLSYLLGGFVVNQDEFAHHGKSSRNKFLNEIKRRGNMNEWLFVDKINTELEHRNGIRKQLPRNTNMILLQFVHPMDAENSFDHAVELCEGRINGRKGAHRTLYPGPHVEGILKRTADNYVPVSEEEKTHFVEIIRVDLTLSPIEMAKSILSSLALVEIPLDANLLFHSKPNKQKGKQKLSVKKPKEQRKLSAEAAERRFAPSGPQKHEDLFANGIEPQEVEHDDLFANGIEPQVVELPVVEDLQALELPVVEDLQALELSGAQSEQHELSDAQALEHLGLSDLEYAQALEQQELYDTQSEQQHELSDAPSSQLRQDEAKSPSDPDSPAINGCLYSGMPTKKLFVPVFTDEDFEEAFQFVKAREDFIAYAMRNQYQVAKIRYIGIFFDAAGQERLDSLIEGGGIHLKQDKTFLHTTLLFVDGKKVARFDEVIAWEHKPVTLWVTALAYDEKAITASVWLPPTVPCNNSHPHITLALAPGISASYSNELLVRAARGEAKFQKITPILLRGTVRIKHISG